MYHYTMISRNYFNECVRSIHTLSTNLNDGWKINENSESHHNGIYLRKKCTQLIEGTPITFEYHVAYNISYQVPVLHFNCWKSDGSFISMEDFWKFFILQEMDFYSILTQMEHPILMRPFLTLHPCHSEEIIESFIPKSKNLVVSWLSVTGPPVYLSLLPDYMKLTE